MSVIFILGNGPSLLQFDLSRASHMGIIFGTNRTSEMCFSSKILQDYYFVNDLRFLADQSRSESAGNKFLSSNTIRVAGMECSYMLPNFSGKTQHIKILGNHGFNCQPEVGLYHGYSIVNFAFQYALSLKPKAIVFTGLDLTYSGSMARFYEAKTTHPPDPIRGKQIAVFRLGLSKAREKGINIFNDSQRSLLAPYMPPWHWYYV